MLNLITESTNKDKAINIKISPALMNKYHRTIIAFRPNKLLHDEGCFQVRCIAPEGKQKNPPNQIVGEEKLANHVLDFLESAI